LQPWQSLWSCNLGSSTSSQLHPVDLMAVNVSLLLAEKLTIYANISRYQPAPNMAVPAPRLYGQCPRCGSLLEVDQFGCLMIDGVVESCATRVWSSQSEDGTEVPTELASDSHDEATLVQAIALVAMEPMDAALATALLDAAAPNAAATVDLAAPLATAPAASAPRAAAGGGPGMVPHVRVGEEVFVHQAGIKRKLK